MKAIMVMFDSLNRHMLPPYGGNWVHAPNFRRLAEKTVTFDRSFVGSMPCMPARRELHTGRYNFLHRSWGPLEPFDDSMPELLKQNGIYTHLVTDHYHYFEDGGCTYHYRYNTWEMVRGQESDAWIGEVKDPEIPPLLSNRGRRRNYWVNRKYMTDERTHPQAQTFAKGMEFIRKNHRENNWFLQIETFDPHEPFLALQKYRELYPHDYSGPHFDWPDYKRVRETPEQVEHLKCEYAALMSMCDDHLGKVLNLMDELDLWKDTMLIVNTDHGFLLGEHGWWAKCAQPFYNEVAHTPLFIWDPRSGVRGERRDCLVQTIDMAPTLLDYFGLEPTAHMQGKPLGAAIADNKPVREAGLFGLHGAHVNCTDGRYVYMRAPVRPDNKPLYNYTLMPTRMRGFFSLEELAAAELAEPFLFTKGAKVMKTDAAGHANSHHFGTLLFDLQNDPGQEHPIRDEQIEQMMIGHMKRLMLETDAPQEQFARLGLHSEAGEKR